MLFAQNFNRGFFIAPSMASRYASFMLILRHLARLFGLILLALAFIATAFEMTAHGMSDDRSVFMSAWKVAYIHWPDQLIQARIYVENHYGVTAWVDWVIPVLSVPGWVSFGSTGVAMLWLSMEKRHPDHDSEMASHEESLFLYDELSRAADDDGFQESEEDIYTDSTRDMQAGWREEGDHTATNSDSKDATPPHRPPPTSFGRR